MEILYEIMIEKSSSYNICEVPLVMNLSLFLAGVCKTQTGLCLQHLFEHLPSVCFALLTFLTYLFTQISQPPAPSSSAGPLSIFYPFQSYAIRSYPILSYPIHTAQDSLLAKKYSSCCLGNENARPDQSHDPNECNHFIRMMGPG